LNQQKIDEIVTNFLFSEDSNVFDEILCSDSAYQLLSDENCIMILTKKMVETEN
jgi:hypothetical protein